MKHFIHLSLLVLLAGCGDVAGKLVAPVGPLHDETIATALSVLISGPAQINSSVICTWEANVVGGTAPYSYSWSTVNGGGTGVDEVWGGGFPLSGSLSVTVTDALGATARTTRNITSTFLGPLCP